MQTVPTSSPCCEHDTQMQADIAQIKADLALITRTLRAAMGATPASRPQRASLHVLPGGAA